MKKIILATTILLFSSQSFAQTFEVPERTKSVLFKMSALWCNPCGYYNFITEDIYQYNNDSILFVYCHCGEDPFSGSMHNRLNGSVGIPSYNVCGDYLTAWPPSYDTIVDHCSSFLSNAPQANIAFNYSIAGNNITVNTTTKFFQDQTNASDKYYVGAFIVENDLTVYQNQYDNEGYGDQLQNRVLRTVLGNSIEDLGIWGDQIATGSITGGTTFDHQFTGILDPSWVQDNIDVVVVVWKRTNDDFQVLSGEDVQYSTAEIKELGKTEKLALYPNPAKKTVTIVTNEIDENTFVHLYDTSGKLVLKQKLTHLNNNLNIEGVKPGVYQVSYANSFEKLIIE